MSRPVLPSFSAIIDAASTASSPLPRPTLGFRMDVQGNIKLPPLGAEPQTPVMRNNLLSITPTTSMLRMGAASISSIEKSDSSIEKSKMSSTCYSTEHKNMDSFRDSSFNRIHIVAPELEHTPSKKSKSFDKNALVLPDSGSSGPSGPTPRSGPVLENRCDAKGTPVSNKKKTLKTKAFAFITHSQETFPSNEPTIDNAQLARRKRRRTSKNESDILKNEFELNPAPSKERRAELASQCNMSEKAVQVWFQNRRQNVRKKFKGNPELLESFNSSPSLRANRVLRELDPNIKTDVSKRDNDENTKKAELTRSPLSEGSPLSKNVQDNVFQTKAINADETKFQKKLKLDIPKYTITSCAEKPIAVNDKGKVLTFRLKQDNELSRVYTSPNNRVNKLINGTGFQNGSTSIAEAVDGDSGENGIETSHLNFSAGRGVLKELDVNVI